MKPITIFDLATEFAPTRRFFTQREKGLVENIIKVVQEKLRLVLKAGTKGDTSNINLEFSQPVKLEQVTNTTEALVCLDLTMFGYSLNLFLPRVLALEIVNCYLNKVPNVVERDLNPEEVAVIALVSTLVISELREAGILGIYLRSAEQLAELPNVANEDIAIEENGTRQTLIAKLAPELKRQIAEHSKLRLIESTLERFVLDTPHVVNLHLRAEVNSLATLLKLKPGVLWKLGEEISPAIELEGEILGYGNLLITDN